MRADVWGLGAVPEDVKVKDIWGLGHGSCCSSCASGGPCSGCGGGTPAPTPGPVPVPVPPVPVPTPQFVPGPAPAPQPVPTPQFVPGPTPAPAPGGQPGFVPGPAPAPAPPPKGVSGPTRATHVIDLRHPNAQRPGQRPGARPGLRPHPRFTRPVVMRSLHGSPQQGVGAYGTPLHTPAEVEALQRHVGSKSSVMDAAVKACTTVDTPTRAGWGAFYAHCQDYSQAQVPSVINQLDIRAMWEEGNSLLGQLDEWRAKLDATGCATPVVGPPSTTGVIDHLITAAKVVGGIALAGGVVYGIVKGLELWGAYESARGRETPRPDFSRPQLPPARRAGYRTHPAFAEAGMNTHETVYFVVVGPGGSNGQHWGPFQRREDAYRALKRLREQDGKTRMRVRKVRRRRRHYSI